MFEETRLHIDERFRNDIESRFFLRFSDQGFLDSLPEIDATSRQIESVPLRDEEDLISLDQDAID